MSVRVTQLPTQVVRTFTSSDSIVRVTQVPVLVVRYASDLDDTIKQEIDVGSSLNLWIDGIGLVETPEGPLQLQLDDLNTYRNDYVELGWGIAVGDDLDNWLDAAIVIIELEVLLQVYDSMFYSWADSATLGYSVGTGVFNDTLSMDDAINILNHLVLIEGDTLTMSDVVQALFLFSNPALADTLALNDGIQLSLSSTKSAADTLSMSDAVALNYISATLPPITEGDDMDNLSDAAETLLSTSDMAYLRRYLDDVVR